MRFPPVRQWPIKAMKRRETEQTGLQRGQARPFQVRERNGQRGAENLGVPKPSLCLDCLFIGSLSPAIPTESTTWYFCPWVILGYPSTVPSPRCMCVPQLRFPDQGPRGCLIHVKTSLCMWDRYYTSACAHILQVAAHDGRGSHLPRRRR